MTTSTFLTILGIVVTVILGAWGVHLAIAQRYPGRITFVKEACIGIFDSIVRNLPELSVSYKDRPVSENLVLLKGFLLNTGSKDVTESMAEKGLSLNLPEDFRWLTARVVSASPNVRGSTRCSERSIFFEMGLFRCNEHIRFEALAEVPAETDRGESTLGGILEQALTFDHRIADTRKVDKQELLTESQRRRWRNQSVLMGSALVGLVAALVVGVWLDRSRAEIQYSLVRGDSTVIDVTGWPRLNGTIELRGVQDGFREVLPIRSFYYDRKWVPKVVPRPIDKPPVLVMVFVGIAPIGYLLLSITELRRTKQLTKLLALR